MRPGRIVARRRAWPSRRSCGNGGRDGARSLEITGGIAESASRALAKMTENPNTTNHMRPTRGRRFYLAVLIGLFLACLSMTSSGSLLYSRISHDTLSFDGCQERQESARAGWGSDAPCSLPRSSTGAWAHRPGPSRRMSASELWGRYAGSPAWSGGPATGKISCFPPSLVCIRAPSALRISCAPSAQRRRRVGWLTVIRRPRRWHPGCAFLPSRPASPPRRHRRHTRCHRATSRA